jgi:ABC-type multidrug transport system fused ATPase/permease subunit
MTRDLRKLWQVFQPSERRKAGRMLLLVVLMALAETAGVLSIMPFLSVLGSPEIVHENARLQRAYTYFRFNGTREFIAALGIVSVVVVIASSLFKVTTQHAINRFVHLQRHSISSRLLTGYLHQPYSFFLGRNSADLSKNILSETDQLLFNLVQPMALLVAQGTIVLAMTVLIFAYDPLMALGILLTVGLLYATIYGVVRKRLARIGAERVEANRERYQTCNEALGGIKDVKVTRAAATYQARFERPSRLYSRHLAANDTLSQTPLYLVEAVGYTGLIFLALFLLIRSEDIGYVLPTLGLYGFAAYRILPAVQIMYRGFARLKFSSPALDAIHHDLMLPVEAERDTRRTIVPAREIRLHDIRFAYPSAPNVSVLTDFNLVIPARTSVGIVGTSGSGKSTVMDLLLGLLRPQAGTLSVDGAVIDAGDLVDWRGSVGYVPQSVFLIDASVAENIAFGIPKHLIDMGAVRRSARIAQIEDFIATLPDAYETLVGERGSRFSGGQRQRIGIARALYRNPEVLFFDEATSALDVETERALCSAMQSLRAQGKTLVAIAHKGSLLEIFDQVIDLSCEARTSRK